MKFAGNVTVPWARLTVTTPSSIGCRIDSSTEWGNSGSSSRKRTPRWLSVISPGRGTRPPPTSPACDIVWWGDRNGRRPGAGRPRHHNVVPARGRHLQRSLHVLLPANVAEVDDVRGHLPGHPL